MQKPLAVAALGFLCSSAIAPEAGAIPAFARRYGVDCSYCHQVFPKLGAEGHRFKERGFRMPGEDRFDAQEWLRSVPVTLRAWGNQLLLEDNDDATTGFFKGISAGNLGKRFSYWLDDAVLVTEADSSHLEPNNAWGRFELATGEKLYLKAGRFELDLPFTQIRTPHLFSYDAFSTTLGFEADNIAHFQDGLELGGAFREDWRWSLALTKGHNSEQALNLSDDAGKFDANLFLRLRRRVNQDRFGAFAYIARNTLARPGGVEFDNDILRYGLDADFWLEKLNIYGAYVHGRDGNAFGNRANPRGTGRAQSFDGGFAQADWHARHNLVLTARLNLVHRPSQSDGGSRQTFASLFPGVQLWLFKHGKLSFEYGFLNRGRNSFGALQAEVAF